MRISDFRLQTADCRLQISDFRLECVPWMEGKMMEGKMMRIGLRRPFCCPKVADVFAGS